MSSLISINQPLMKTFNLWASVLLPCIHSARRELTYSMVVFTRQYLNFAQNKSKLGKKNLFYQNTCVTETAEPLEREIYLQR